MENPGPERPGFFFVRFRQNRLVFDRMHPKVDCLSARPYEMAEWSFGELDPVRPRRPPPGPRFRASSGADLDPVSIRQIRHHGPASKAFSDREDERVLAFIELQADRVKQSNCAEEAVVAGAPA